MKVNERQVVEMIDKRTKEKVYHTTTREEASNIFFNRKDNKQYDIVCTMPEYHYKHLIDLGMI